MTSPRNLMKSSNYFCLYLKMFRYTGSCNVFPKTDYTCQHHKDTLNFNKLHLQCFDKTSFFENKTSVLKVVLHVLRAESVLEILTNCAVYWTAKQKKSSPTQTIDSFSSPRRARSKSTYVIARRWTRDTWIRVYVRTRSTKKFCSITQRVYILQFRTMYGQGT